MEKQLENEYNFNSPINVAVSSINKETKTVSAILSDETPVVRYNWEDGLYDLILSHDKESIDLSRADIMPLLCQHERGMLPMGNWQNIRIEDGKLKGDAVFDSEDKFAMEVFGKFERGFMKSFSIGIGSWEKVLVADKNENGRKLYKAVKWSLDECSAVTIPANHNAKVGLNKESRVNSASAQIKITEKGESMSKDTYTHDEVLALEATHAEALANLQATHEAAIVAVSDEVRTQIVTERTGFSKEVIAMAFDRGISKEAALKMMEASDLTSAKAMMVDGMMMDTKPTGEQNQAKVDSWSDFK